MMTMTKMMFGAGGDGLNAPLGVGCMDNRPTGIMS